MELQQPAPVLEPQTPVRRPAATARDKWYALVLILFSVIWVDFSLFSEFNLGYTICTAVFFVICLLYGRGKGGKIRPYPLFCGVCAVAASVPFALYTADRFWGFCLVAALMALFALLTADCNFFDAGSFRTVGDVALNFVVTPFRYLPAAFAGLFGRQPDGKESRTGRIWLGVLLSVPVVLIVVPLLIVGNPYFKHLFDTLFNSLGELLVRIALGLLIFPLLYAVLYAYHHGLPRAARKPEKEHPGRIDPIVIQSFLTVLSVVYLIYTISQLAYFFSAFRGALPKGYEFTVAEYARKGFFEICAVAAVNLAVIFFAVWSVRKKEGGATPAGVKGFGCFVCLFTLLLIGTALSKMVLYIRNFGMTRLRLGTSCFMVFLAVVFILALIRLYAEKFPYMKGVVCALCIVALAVGWVNLDRVVACYNVNAYQNGILEEMDVDTLSNLSDAAVPYLVPLLDDKDPEVSARAHNALLEALDRHYEIVCSAHDKEDEWCEQKNVYQYFQKTSDFDPADMKPEEGTADNGKLSLRLRENHDGDFRYYNREQAETRQILSDVAPRLLPLSK